MTEVNIKYFASLREALGPGEHRQTQALTVGQLRDELIALGAPYAQVLDRQRPVRAALNQVMSEEDQPLSEGCELAFFPPVTGG